MGGDRGVGVTNLHLTNVVVTGAGTGVSATRMKVTGSTVTGNVLDIDSDMFPKLRATTCDTSNGWGVCTND